MKPLYTIKASTVYHLGFKAFLKSSFSLSSSFPPVFPQSYPAVKADDKNEISK